MDFKQKVVDLVSEQVDLPKEKISMLIERPKNPKMGDYAFPAFALAKIEHKNPALIAKNIAEKISDDNFASIQAVGPYVNFAIDHAKLVNATLNDVLTEKEHFGDQKLGEGNVPIDMSSPNIAKPMSMGHLRSTVIGNSIAKTLEKVGYTPIKINYLGDYGTQFGKLITAYRLWGNEEDVKKDPITNLFHYYVKFHEEAEKDPKLEDEGRAAFKKLENGDEEEIKLWKWFREVSLQEFNRIYKELGVTFDSYNGEAFFNDKMQPVVDELREKGLLEESRGAQVVNLGEDENPALILKSDGSSLYMTRDLAAALYRKKEYDFVMSLYVAGGEQTGHFKQLKQVLKKMGYDWSDNIHHIPFGLITQGGKKLSTRKGNVVFLDQVLKDAVSLAEQQIEEKNPNLSNKKQVAHDVGVGAVVFHDLKNDRMDNFDFDLEEVVRFEGDTGPYVQYTNARAQSILRKANKEISMDNLSLNDDWSFAVAKALADFPAIVEKASEKFEPSIIAKYALDLSKKFNKYYANVRILDEDDQLNARLALVQATSIVLTEALRLLGVNAPKEM
ncbi:arginine--tRNA ligase [Lactobacillus johnsonii]|uniref:Arginine--tRNA ligase n=1 Tax=Lactobacillus johnsonii ATCC 33200 TaxID=525330 RepID=C2E7T8_LACJH|nr:arginine--tRNA ligase [Lactobacillus johnsonii]EEJ59130.1 arginine--tRNA ligase [Lactobacillus johnsonii ATCC 33200]KRK55575.1 arginyl-tRNA synthetase [Lactobacillus johnsonii ATCC 33200]MCF0084007.1 arginine--tRNA ligase [Lactobacillus johnsonii]MCT3322797.1 arginine--tRNA ligase [Lactobacillus johnsonii]MCT3380637.1 arginine--tRNA ligase [Lactobacillus johnsonii]